jgi:hypothetical protein
VLIVISCKYNKIWGKTRTKRAVSSKRNKKLIRDSNILNTNKRKGSQKDKEREKNNNLMYYLFISINFIY